MLAPSTPADMDVGFVLICAALVFLMQAGFCLLESGMIRAKNSINVAIKNLLDFSISMLAFAAFGFGIMFGVSQWGLFGTPVDFWSNNELGAFFLYQMVFCGTAATIVSGAVAERTKLSTYLLIVLCLSGFTYPLIGHWCWGGTLSNTGAGWLASLGFADWAGASVVHITGGFAALAAIIAIGPRRGYGRGSLTGGHSLTLAIMGCFLLWFGWWGFNGGSGLSTDNNVSRVLLNTNLGAVAGMLAAAAWSLKKCHGKTDVVDLITGTLAGLVSVTGACHVLSPLASGFAGAVGAIIALVSVELLKRNNIDDAVGAFGVHGAAGVWGTLVFGLFAPAAELHTTTRLLQIVVQGLGVLVAVTLSFGSIYGVLRLMGRFTRLRVKAGEERIGLNVVEHGATNEVTDLLTAMNTHRHTGRFDTKLQIDTDTEVGQIAQEYNAVIERVSEEASGREEINRNLRGEKLRLQSVLEHAGVGIYQLDENGHFQSANSTLLEIFGYSSASTLIEQEEAYRLPWHDDWQETRTLLSEHFHKGTSAKDVETEFVTTTGETRWLLESIVPVRDDKGCLVTWLGTVHDVTEGKQSLLAEVEIAEAKSKAKGEFLANMSHEIRTPLNGVIGMLDLLATSQLDGKDANYVGVARSSAETLLAQINDILDFSKIEAGKLELECVDFDLRELMESTAEQFAVRAHMSGLEMNCELARDLPFKVQGDPERLRQVIVNLMGNAIKFTESGEINLRVSRRGNVIRFAVQDTGIGIPSDALDSLFESFVQADLSTTRRYGGSGLGLSIANQLVRKMKGQLKVDSVVGEGSEFWFELPLTVVMMDAPESADSLALMSGLTDFNVLIIDDNTTNCEILQNQLANWGLRSCVCNQSTAAVQKMLVAGQLQNPYDLVILDFCMPDMNGRDLAKEFQRHEALRDIPILMLSSNHDLMTQRELDAVGIDVAMTKPARQSRLFDSIVTLLYKKQTHAASEAANTPINEPLVAPKPIETSVSAPVATPMAVATDSFQADVSTGPSSEPAIGSIRVRAADVLIAEDNQINQLVVQQMLQQLGYTSEVADNGQIALDRVQHAQYGMVLMDGHMPVMDGLLATRAIRQWEQRMDGANDSVSRTPVVALTANVISGIRKQCSDAGMDDYLCKPITLQRLNETVLHFVGPPAQKQTTSSASSDQSAPSKEEQTSEAVSNEQPTSVDVDPAPTIPDSIKRLVASDDLADDPIWFDQPALTARCGGDLAFQHQILSIMRDTLPTRMADLRQAGQQNDWARVKTIAHQLRGAAGDSALLAVQEAAGQLEQCAIDRDATQVNGTLAVLESRVDKTLSFLSRSLTSLSEMP